MKRLKFCSRQMFKDEPDQPKSYADLTSLIEKTGWRPSYSIENGIEATIKALQKNNNYE